MSLDTVPKTNFESDDGVLFSDFNEVGANLQALEDSKNQDGDSPTYETANITTANITELNVDNINPISLTVASIFISDATSWTPSAGFYIIEDLTNVTIQIDSSGFKTTIAGSFFTDGSLVRVANTSGGDVTLNYLKL